MPELPAQDQMVMVERGWRCAMRCWRFRSARSHPGAARPGGLAEAQVADIWGCSVGTVRSQTHKAIAQLRLGPAVTGPDEHGGRQVRDADQLIAGALRDIAAEAGLPGRSPMLPGGPGGAGAWPCWPPRQRPSPARSRWRWPLCFRWPRRPALPPRRRPARLSRSRSRRPRGQHGHAGCCRSAPRPARRTSAPAGHPGPGLRAECRADRARSRSDAAPGPRHGRRAELPAGAALPAVRRYESPAGHGVRGREPGEPAHARAVPQAGLHAG